MLQASEFHLKKHHVNSKGSKKEFSITRQQVKDIIKKFPACPFYNQTALSAGSNPKDTRMKSGRWMCSTLQNLE